MVMFLILNVPGNHIHLWWIYWKNAITFLPIEVGIAFSFCLDPFGRSLLYLLNQTYLRHFFGKQAKNVNMIFMATNLNGVAFKTFAYSAEIIKQIWFYGFINGRLAMFGAEYDVGIDFWKGLWHGCGLSGLRSFGAVYGGFFCLHRTPSHAIADASSRRFGSSIHMICVSYGSTLYEPVFENSLQKNVWNTEILPLRQSFIDHGRLRRQCGDSSEAKSRSLYFRKKGWRFLVCLWMIVWISLITDSY